MTIRLSRVGALLADPTRAGILTALMDRRAYTGSELARGVGVAQSTTSEHLSKLLDAEMITVESQGRHRYFRLAGPQIAELLETLGAAPTGDDARSSRAPAGLVYARTCYDHLAGQLAVTIYDGLIDNGHIREIDHPSLEFNPTGLELFDSLGVDMAAVNSTRRSRMRRCLDWTERRHHLAGALGAQLLDLMLAKRWLARGQRPRSIRVTRTGQSEIARWFGSATN